jgi:hypothetical protein
LEFLAAMPRGVAMAPRMLLKKQASAARKSIAEDAKSFYRKQS